MAGLNLHQVQKLAQTLVMTPQLQQAIKMLQLSNLELSAFVEAEIEQNPLLEPGEREAEDGTAPGTEPQADASAVNGVAEVLPGFHMAAFAATDPRPAQPQSRPVAIDDLLVEPTR